MCLNDEVVMLQPWTVITPDLGAVTNYTFYSNPPAPPVSTVLWIFLFLLSTLPPHTSSVSHCIPYLLHPLPTSSTSTNFCPPGRHPHPPPASLRLSSLRPAPHACLCAVSCDCVPTKNSPLACSRVHVRPWGVLPLLFPPRL